MMERPMELNMCVVTWVLEVHVVAGVSHENVELGILFTRSLDVGEDAFSSFLIVNQ